MGTFDPFVDQKVALLTTYRKDGTPVKTPVNVVVVDERAYFRTYDESWKAKRLAHTKKVEVAPGTAKGVATGPALSCRARPLEEAEIEAVRQTLADKHPIRQGLIVPMIHRLKHYQTLYYELIPVTVDAST
jgi:PPOX class probable F420-dependent enzyme